MAFTSHSNENSNHETTYVDSHCSSSLDTSHEYSHPYVAILAPFFLLASGAFLKCTFKNIPVPYTVLLLILGGGIGIGLKNESWNDEFAQSMNFLAEIPAHLLLHIFLPPLIFESAFSIEWYIFDKMKYKTVFLAGPGLVFSTFAIGLLFNRILIPLVSDTSFEECPEGEWIPAIGYLLGAVLSATDPVAVVALLKELGVPADLSTLIEGESLLNDGTALVVYTVLVQHAEGCFEMNPVDIVWQFIKMSLGGVVFGVLMGFGSVHWLAHIFNDAMVEITITLAVPYLTFYLAENLLHISGVLALVALGLYYGMEGRSRISPEVQHFLGEFWELLAYFGNTLVFIIAGLVIMKSFPDVTALDFAILLVVYVFCHITRAIAVGSVHAWSVFRRRPTNRNYDIVSIWGGLRGAVGLALALLVKNDHLICNKYQDVVLFQTAGLVLLTVIVNGSTMRPLLMRLGIDKVHSSRLLIFNQAVKALKESEEVQEAHLKQDSLFDNANWEKVKEFYFEVPRLKVIEESEIEKSLVQGHRWSVYDRGASSEEHLITSYNPLNSSSGDLVDASKQRQRLKSDKRLKSFSRSTTRHSGRYEASISSSNVFVNSHDVKEARRRLLMVCKKSYWRQFEMGLLSQEAAKFLMYTTDKALDRGCMMVEWAYFEHTLTTFKHKSLITGSRRSLGLQFINSIWYYCVIVALSLTTATLAFTVHSNHLEDLETVYTIHCWITVVFTLELSLRLYLLGDILSFFRDPFTVLDLSVVIIDIIIYYHPNQLGYIGYSLNLLRLAKGIQLILLWHSRKRKGKEKDDHSKLWTESDHFFSRIKRKFIYHRVQFDYEVVCGFLSAREEGLQVLSELIDSKAPHFSYVREQALNDIRSAKIRLELMSQHYAEISKSMATYVAARTVLNRQRAMIEHLHHEGLLDPPEAIKMLAAVEHQMKKLMSKPPVVALPNKDTLLRNLEWTQNLQDDVINSLKPYFVDMVTEKGEYIIKKGAKDFDIYVVARGNFTIYDGSRKRKKEIGTLTMGMTFGEISWALKQPRNADVISQGPGLIYKLDGEILRSLVGLDPDLADGFWDFVCRRLAENLLYKESSVTMTRRMVKQTLLTYHPYYLTDETVFHFQYDAIIVLIIGTAEVLESAAPTPRIKLFVPDEEQKSAHHHDDFIDNCEHCIAEKERRDSRKAYILTGPTIIQVNTELTYYSVKFDKGSRFMAERTAFLLDPSPQRRSNKFGRYKDHFSIPNTLIKKNIPVTDSRKSSMDAMKNKHSLRNTPMPLTKSTEEKQDQDQQINFNTFRIERPRSLTKKRNNSASGMIPTITPKSIPNPKSASAKVGLTNVGSRKESKSSNLVAPISQHLTKKGVKVFPSFAKSTDSQTQSTVDISKYRYQKSNSDLSEKALCFTLNGSTANMQERPSTESNDAADSFSDFSDYGV